jgi:hypothetical protein
MSDLDDLFTSPPADLRIPTIDQTIARDRALRAKRLAEAEAKRSEAAAVREAKAAATPKAKRPKAPKAD